MLNREVTGPFDMFCNFASFFLPWLKTTGDMIPFFLLLNYIALVGQGSWRIENHHCEEKQCCPRNCPKRFRKHHKTHGFMMVFYYCGKSKLKAKSHCGLNVQPAKAAVPKSQIVCFSWDSGTDLGPCLWIFPSQDQGCILTFGATALMSMVFHHDFSQIQWQFGAIRDLF